MQSKEPHADLAGAIRVSFQLTTRHRVALVVILIGATVGFLAWLCLRNSGVAFLHDSSSAEWIVFPSAPNVSAHRTIEMDAVLQRIFTLDTQPQAAQLSVRAYKHFQLMINGDILDVRTGPNWKEVSKIDVASHLRRGTNTIVARVFNNSGPPALWLNLMTDQFTLRSDETWQTSFAGSAWRDAARASVQRKPRPGNLMAGGERTFESVARVWPIWLAFGGIAFVVCITGRRWLNHIVFNDTAAANPLQWEEIVPLVVVVALWVTLFSHNARLLPVNVGFDAPAHIDYIKYIQKRGSLPLPNDGPEMFQPPLYYGISAGVLSTLGLSTTDPTSAIVLRFLTMFFGIAHLTLVFLSMRLLFPGQPGRQLIALLLAAFLPMHLYLSHYVTNETLMALLVSGAVYVCLRIFKTGINSWKWFISLGFILGAAVLTKFTAVMAVPLITVALARQFIARREPAGIWSKKLLVMLGTTALVSGWHYVRIWKRVGSVVIGGWDPACKLDWWQEDGFHTASFFFRFGESLIRPLFSCTKSFMDGVYSTMWGDGLCAGGLGLVFRPPWNYDLVCAGYLLAVFPTLLILVGATMSAVKLIREGGADRFVLVGLASAMGVALIYVNLKVPYYASVKSFYGLCALVPLCFFAVTGWNIITRGRKLVQSVLGVILLAWAMNSFASVWIRGGSAAMYLCQGFTLAGEGLVDEAASKFSNAVKAEPSNAQARRWLTWSLIQIGKTDEAMQNAATAVQLSPTDATCHLQLGTVLHQLGLIGNAISEAQRAMELGPDHTDTYRQLWVWLTESGRYGEAMNVVREGLAVDPYDPDMRCELGAALMRAGDMRAATNQFTYALLLQPNGVAAHVNFGLALLQLGYSAAGLEHLEEAVRLAPNLPLPLTELAWVRATHPDAALRDGAEAVRLAERACSLVPQRSPKLLGVLAAAYAEVGRFSEATNVLQEAISLAHSGGDQKVIGLYENMRASFQSDRPYRENPERNGPL